MDATLQHYDIAKKKAIGVLKSMGLKDNAYNLLTAHRPANVDDPARLKQLIDIMQVVIAESGNPILFPIHPRTRSKLETCGLTKKLPAQVKLVDPVGYIKFLILEKHARLILTDSGGVQEEACILRRPCITLRDNTERPETVDVGANVIAGYDIDKIKKAMVDLPARKFDYKIPFGDGDASEKIFAILHA